MVVALASTEEIQSECVSGYILLLELNETLVLQGSFFMNGPSNRAARTAKERYSCFRRI